MVRAGYKYKLYATTAEPVNEAAVRRSRQALVVALVLRSLNWIADVVVECKNEWACCMSLTRAVQPPA